MLATIKSFCEINMEMMPDSDFKQEIIHILNKRLHFKQQEKRRGMSEAYQTAANEALQYNSCVVCLYQRPK